MPILKIKNDRVKGLSYEMVKALKESKITIFVEGTGPYGEDQGAEVISFSADDADGEIDLGEEEVLTAEDADDLVVLDHNIGQTGCDWTSYDCIKDDTYIRSYDLAAASAIWYNLKLI